MAFVGSAGAGGDPAREESLIVARLSNVTTGKGRVIYRLVQLWLKLLVNLGMMSWTWR